MLRRSIYPMAINCRSYVTLLLVLAAVGCGDARVPPAPRSLPGTQVAAIVHSLPPDAHLSLVDLAFFKGKLYVGSNIGLFTVNGETIETLYKWVQRNDVVEGPWLDSANDLLWLQHAHDNSLARFDGKAWRKMEMPYPPKGYFSRGDLLWGFRGISGPAAFWLVGGGVVWRYDAATTTWLPEPEPPAPLYSSTRAVVPCGRTLFYIVREGVPRTKPSMHAAYDRANEWGRYELSPEMDLGGVVTTADRAFVRTHDGRLFSVQPGRVANQPGPGRCEAIAKTSNGNLLASFVGHGIFELADDEWKLRVAYPYGDQEGQHWAYLAESNGVVAYATSAVPHLDIQGRTTYSGSVALWVQRGPALRSVALSRGASRR